MLSDAHMDNINKSSWISPKNLSRFKRKFFFLNFTVSAHICDESQNLQNHLIISNLDVFRQHACICKKGMALLIFKGKICSTVVIN